MRTSDSTMSGSSSSTTLSARSAPTAWPTTSTRSEKAASIALRPSMTISWSSTRTILTDRHGNTLGPASSGTPNMAWPIPLMGEAEVLWRRSL